MKTLILAILLIGCGTENDEPIDQVVLGTEQTAKETPTIMMCQQATACTAEGECFDIEKEVEFEIDSSLIYWQACFNFRPCKGNNVYTEEQVQFYRDEYCED